MNHVFLPLAKSFLVALLTVSSMVGAAEPKKIVKADPAKGEAIYINGDAARNITACVSCHGAAGNSTIVQNPKLAAQHEAYIYKQLVDFKTPGRNNPIMTPIVKPLTDEEMKNIAAYLDTQTQKPGAAKNKDTIEIGKKIYRAGIAEKNVPACAGLHGSPASIRITLPHSWSTSVPVHATTVRKW
jgi:cytochrome c553